MNNIGLFMAKGQFHAVVLCMFFLSNGVAFSMDFVKSQAELALLPKHCSCAENVREFSKDPRSMEDCMQAYGGEFRHFHHYCWGLNTENNAARISDKYLKESKLKYAVQDLDYSITRSRNEFVFMPDMLIAKARILSKLNRYGEAVGVLLKLIEIKPDYVISYRDLSTYYEKIGLKDKAITTLGDGLKVAPESKLLRNSYHRLSGKEFIPPNEPTTVPTPTKDMATAQPATTVDSLESNTPPQQTNPELPSASSSQQEKTTPQENRPNPYCRFCP